MQTIALSMIVRDASAILKRCLKSAAPAVDQIVVADTGSTDNTPELARACGAEVISIPWEKDFARARNLALAPVHTDWILVLDADEMLDPEATSLLPGLVSAPVAHGYQVKIRNYVPKLEYRLWDRIALPNDSTLPEARHCPAYLEHENVRLFRRSPDIFFIGRVHESVGWRIESSGRKLGTATFVIHHFGLIATEADLHRKNILYRELGRMKVAEMPWNAEAHLELGLAELDNFQNEREALQYFERACELKPSLGIAWFFAGVASYRLADYPRALHCLKRACQLGHAPVWTDEFLGDSYYNLGNFHAALESYRRAARLLPRSNEIRSKLGLAEVRDGHFGTGLARMQEAIACDPSNPQLYDRLIQAAVWTGRMAQAANAAERKLQIEFAEPRDFVRAAGIRAKAKQLQDAIRILEEGITRFSESELLHRALSELKASESTGHIRVVPIVAKK